MSLYSKGRRAFTQAQAVEFMKSKLRDKAVLEPPNPKAVERRKRSRAAMLGAPLKFPTVRKIIYPDYS